MLSIERVKELVNDPTLADKEIEEIRDGLRLLAELIFEKWQEDRKAGRLNGPKQAKYDPEIPLKQGKSATLL